MSLCGWPSRIRAWPTFCFSIHQDVRYPTTTASTPWWIETVGDKEVIPGDQRPGKISPQDIKPDYKCLSPPPLFGFFMAEVFSWQGAVAREQRRHGRSRHWTPHGPPGDVVKRPPQLLGNCLTGRNENSFHLCHTVGRQAGQKSRCFQGNF